jgi:hypothetical protein
MDAREYQQFQAYERMLRKFELDYPLLDQLERNQVLEEMMAQAMKLAVGQKNKPSTKASKTQ